MRSIQLVVAFLLTWIAKDATLAANSCSGHFTLTDANKASSLAAGCKTITGDVSIATDVSGSIALDGPTRIKGSLMLKFVDKLTTISSNSLDTIEDTLWLEDNRDLSNFSFPALKHVHTMQLQGLPNNQQLSFLQTLETASQINIQDTQLTQLEGFALPSADKITVANNLFMNSINLQVFNVTTSLNFEANGQGLQVSLPNIVWAYDMSFRNCSMVSTPSLQWINGSLGMFSNYMDEFNTAPLLTGVVDTLALVSNENLAKFSLPELKSVGSIQITNNTQLTKIEDLYSLKRVNGSVSLDGDFTTVSLLELSDIQGDFDLQSSKALSCNDFDQLAREGAIKGRYTCETATDSGRYSSLGGLSSGAKAGIGVAIAIVGIITVALLAYLLWRRRRRNRTPSFPQIPEKDGSEIDDANMLGNDVEKFELEQPTAQLPSGVLDQELPAGHGASELGRSASTRAATAGVIQPRHEMPANEAVTPISSKDSDEATDSDDSPVSPEDSRFHR